MVAGGVASRANMALGELGSKVQDDPVPFENFWERVSADQKVMEY